MFRKKNKIKSTWDDDNNNNITIKWIQISTETLLLNKPISKCNEKVKSGKKKKCKKECFQNKLYKL